MRIVFLSHSARLGGAELALCELVDGLTRTGAAEAEVLLPRGGPLAEELGRAGARVGVRRSQGWATLRRSRLALPAMAALDVPSVALLAARLMRSRPDVVVTNSLTNPCGALAARLAGVRHLWLVNEFGDLDHGYRFLLGVPRTLAAVGRLSAGVLACSRAVAERVATHVDPRKVTFAYYAVTMPTGAPPERGRAVRGPLRLLLLGKKHEGKGQLDAVRALALLLADGVDARLRLVGDGEPAYEERVRALATDLRAGDAVESVAFTAEPAREIDAADVVVMCSRAEGFGRVTVEAMRRFRPVVGARAGATTELLEGSGGGLLYPPGDARALADRVASLHADPELALRLARSGSRWAAEHCTPDGYLNAFLALARGANASG